MDGELMVNQEKIEQGGTLEDAGKAIHELVRAAGTGVEIITKYRDSSQQRKNEQKVANIHQIKLVVNLVSEIAEIAPDMINNGCKAVNNLINATVMTKESIDNAKTALNLKNHGSKVKMGLFADCIITNFADRACIIDDENNIYIELTSANVIKCRYIEEKFRPSKMKKYYYYEILFNDGNKSYVRMSDKYRKYLEKYNEIIFD